MKKIVLTLLLILLFPAILHAQNAQKEACSVDWEDNMQVSFVKKEAIEKNDSSICKQICDTGSIANTVDLCMTEVALVKNDVEICKQIERLSGRDQCYIEIALQNNNISICKESVEEYKYQCVFELAEKYNKTEYCSLAEDPTIEKGSYFASDLRDCYMNIAINNGDFKSCLLIKLDNDRDYCLSKLALDKKDYEICLQIINGQDKDNCIRDISRHTYDPSSCPLIKNEYTRGDCYIFIASIKKTPSLCDNIAPKSGASQDAIRFDITREKCYQKSGLDTNNYKTYFALFFAFIIIIVISYLHFYIAKSNNELVSHSTLILPIIPAVFIVSGLFTEIGSFNGIMGTMVILNYSLISPHFILKGFAYFEESILLIFYKTIVAIFLPILPLILFMREMNIGPQFYNFIFENSSSSFLLINSFLLLFGPVPIAFLSSIIFIFLSYKYSANPSKKHFCILLFFIFLLEITFSFLIFSGFAAIGAG